MKKIIISAVLVSMLVSSVAQAGVSDWAVSAQSAASSAASNSVSYAMDHKKSVGAGIAAALTVAGFTYRYRTNSVFRNKVNNAARTSQRTASRWYTSLKTSIFGNK